MNKAQKCPATRVLLWLFALCEIVHPCIGVCQTDKQQRAVMSQHSEIHEPAHRKGTISFENALGGSKIAFELKNSVSPQRYSIETMMGGVAVFDYNNDGLPDIFFTNGAEIPSLVKTGPMYWNRLFRNNGDGTFTDVTEQAGVAGIGYSMGVAAGDYDNDGFVDLYVAGVNANQLLHNNGDGTFTDVTLKAHVNGTVKGMKEWAVTAAWLDYDRDGRLDLLVMNYLKYDLHSAALCSVGDYPAYCSPDGFQGTHNVLYHNNGDGTFTDVSESSHIAQYTGKAMGVAIGDYDNDGYPDIFVSNDTFQNYLFHNNGDGTFTDVSLESGVAYTALGNTVAGMGAEFRDLDNDGWPDIFHTAMFGNTFPLYRNTGRGTFEDITAPSGISAISARMTAWGTGAFDFDNDGFKDIFFAGAEILDNSDKIVHRPSALPDLVLRNNGKMEFEKAWTGEGKAGVAAHRGAAFGDFNNDGKIDAVVTVLNGVPELLMNRTGGSNHWIELLLVGLKSNRDGLGTRVKLITASGTQYNEATTAVGYNSSSDKRVHFGLNKDSVVQEIDLDWPSGIHQVLRNIRADQVLTVTESAQGTGAEFDGKNRAASTDSPF